MQGLSEESVSPDPFVQFNEWMALAAASHLPQPDAMAVATTSRSGQPSARMVLLKEYGPDGFVFYTNYESRKGEELEANPRIAAVLFWSELHRQIRIEGRAEKLPAQRSDAYFASRPPGSRISAAASPQSRVIRDREELERRVRNLEEALGDGDVPRPASWGGYRIVPSVLEFWQGREDRLHDRLRYRLGEDGAWIVERLAP